MTVAPTEERASYEVWLLTPTGQRLACLDDLYALDYALALHEVGTCSVTLPLARRSLVQPDSRLAIWRKPTGSAWHLERTYFVRQIVDSTDASGKRSITLKGVDGNYLLQSRIVAYAAGAAQASKTDYADDMCKDVVRENLGTSAAAARQVAAVTVAADLGGGPSISKAFSWRPMLEVLKDIVQAARTAGTAVYWDMEPNSETTWLFLTATNQIGIDHRWPSGSPPVLLGMEYGNLAAASVTESYAAEVSYVYAGGVGEGADRAIVEVTDAARATRSAFARREVFRDGRNSSSSTVLTADAQAALTEGKPLLRFAGQVAETIGTRYGVQWRWGDRLTADYYGRTFDVYIRTLQVTLDSDGRETVSAGLEAETWLS